MPDITSAVSEGMRFWQIAGAGMTFALLFPSVSFLVNRRLCDGALKRDVPGIALLASLVFVLAILCEATINPIYENLFNEKLWHYRIWPLHNGNISALSVLVWTSYGVHLYFLNQTLNSWFAAGINRNLFKAMIIGVEAPLLWEVLGNGYFLLVLNDYYAYYLPGDVFHLTSLRVIPVYIVCIYLGLIAYERLQAHANKTWLSMALFAFGLVFLGTG
jgi:hypothetical protein